jgi:uncharacterized cupin superfamily protein
MRGWSPCRFGRVSKHIVHWDDLESVHGEAGSISSHWTNLSRAAGSVRIRANRIRVDPGKRSTPLHAESDEEIFFILDGSGLAWQREDEPDATDETFEVRAGDCLVHLEGAEAHTLVAGENGIDALAFGVGPEWPYAYFPRLSALRLAHAIVDVDGRHQWPMEGALPEPELPEPGPRPSRIVNVHEVEPEPWGRGDVSVDGRDLGVAAGSLNTGINYNRIAPGKLSTPPHCHSVEEELFVILDGDGVCMLGDEEHPVRAGHVVARPASTRVAHAFRAGDGGLTMLAYGTRDPNDICYYPRSDKIYFRGVGVMTRVPRLDYWDGEA